MVSAIWCDVCFGLKLHHVLGFIDLATFRWEALWKNIVSQYAMANIKCKIIGKKKATTSNNKHNRTGSQNTYLSNSMWIVDDWMRIALVSHCSATATDVLLFVDFHQAQIHRRCNAHESCKQFCLWALLFTHIIFSFFFTVEITIAFI